MPFNRWTLNIGCFCHRPALETLALSAAICRPGTHTLTRGEMRSPEIYNYPPRHVSEGRQQTLNASKNVTALPERVTPESRYVSN